MPFFRLCQSLLGGQAGDSLVIVHLKEAGSFNEQEGQKLLRTFTHMTCEHLILVSCF
jgi:hypothetical protein